MQRKCLIIDDSRMVRAIARNHMEALGFAVVDVEGGVEGLMHLSQESPDLVLVDWNMPEMDGIAFIRSVRANADNCQPKLLLCSTEKRLHMIRMALRAGADSYLMKPFDRNMLAHRLGRFGLI
jgi:two-component system, chemotaxis family, chemotaxis protein CheY